MSGSVFEKMTLSTDKSEIKVDSLILPKMAELETKDGDIRMEFSAAPSITLDFHEEKGKYVSDFSLDERDGRLVSGDGACQLKVTTKSGTLYLTEK